MKRGICIGLLIGLAIDAAAQRKEWQPTVDELLRMGVEHAISVRSAVKNEAVAQRQVKTARTSYLPTVRMSVSDGIIGQPVVFQRGLAHPTFPETPNWSQSYAIDISQPIYSGGSLRLGVSRARVQENIARLNSEETQQDVKMTLLRHYLDLLTLYKQRELLRQNISESQLRLRNIKAMRGEGMLTKNDELRSLLDLTNDSLNVAETDDRIALVSQQIDLLTGMDEETIVMPDTAILESKIQLRSLDDYISMAYSQYPAMKRTEENVNLANIDLKMAKAELLPTLSLTAGNTLARPVSSTMADMYNNTWNIRLNLAYNISSIYQSRHRIGAARISIATRQDDVEQMKQDLRTAVRTAYTNHVEALRRIEAMNQSVVQANENYRIMRSRYLNRLCILTDLLDANSVRLQAELSLVTAKADAVYSYYELRRICSEI